MRRPLLAAFVLVPAFALAMAEAGLFTSTIPAVAQTPPPAPKARTCDEHCNAKWMDANLRTDQLQVVGTAQSYKQRPDSALMGLIRMGGRRDAEALDFALPTLDAQLDN